VPFLRDMFSASRPMLVAVLVAVVAAPAPADSPMSPAAMPMMSSSVDGRFRVVFDGKTVVVESRASSKAWRKRWSRKLKPSEGSDSVRWADDVEVAADGRTVVVCGPAHTAAFELDAPAISFHSKEHDVIVPIKSLVTAAEVVQTTSGRTWGACVGRAADGRSYVLETSSCKRVTFRVADGAIVATELVSGPRPSGCRPHGR
jgi:hypothetical protein